jgi:integrase
MRVTLQARIRELRDGELRFVFHNVPTEKNGKPIMPKEPPNASTFYLRFTEGGKRTVQNVGANFSDAVTALRNKQAVRELTRLGVDVPTTIADPTGRKTIADAHAEFLKNIEIDYGTALRKSTLHGYDRAVTLFRKACPGVVFVDQLNLQAVRNFIEWHQDEKNVKRRAHGDSNGTICTRLEFLKHFFLENGVKFPLAKADFPPVGKKRVEVFTDDDLNQILSKATPDEADLIYFLLCTGFRDDEAAHAEYTDIRGNKINTENKPQYNFHTKNGDRREEDIELPKFLLDRLAARRKRNPEGSFIFPNGKGGVDTTLLARVRNAAHRAGYRKHFGLHKFRKTFGTRVAEKTGINNARVLLGHSTLDMTQKYLGFTGVKQTATESLFANVKK